MTRCRPPRGRRNGRWLSAAWFRQARCDPPLAPGMLQLDLEFATGAAQTYWLLGSWPATGAGQRRPARGWPAGGGTSQDGASVLAGGRDIVSSEAWHVLRQRVNSRLLAVAGWGGARRPAEAGFAQAAAAAQRR